MKRTALLTALAAPFACSLAAGRGVSPYLPLHLEPEIERQIERVLILGDEAVITRPIPAARVAEALPKACAVDRALCERVRRYLARFMRTAGITHASLEGAVTDGSGVAVPNRYGLGSASEWSASASAYWQPFDFALVSLGGVAYEDDATPAGSVVSVGFHWAQLDLGYRGHWLSPFTDSSMLIGTHAQTMPSATLSNYAPLTRLGIHYEAFVARMSRTDGILFQGSRTSGEPRVAGVHVSIAPASGWSLGANRVLQFGGGGRSASFGDFFDAFFNPRRYDNLTSPSSPPEQFGNQLASITSRFVYPGRRAFAVYAEYAGEDTAPGDSFFPGLPALSMGLHVPRLGEHLELTYELSEWQNGWYVHPIYLDGLMNEGRVIGHWGGNARQFDDAVGARSQMIELGWEPPVGGSVELRYRTLANESYSPVAYSRAHDLTLAYSRQLGEFLVGAQLYGGRDVFGEDFSRVAAFFRYAPFGGGGTGSVDDIGEQADAQGAEMFVSVGVNAYELTTDLDDQLPGFERSKSGFESSAHVAIGARRAVSARSDLGARLDLDDIDGRLLLGVRLLDYRYRFANPLALTAFFGAARYDAATPAHGLYWGLGAQWRDLLPGWDLGLEHSYASKVAREDVLPSDPAGGRPDSFYNIWSATLSLSRRF